ncbi:MAG TPA: NDP-sugar synthase [Candidatus Tyrphobacter sp.]
MILAGGLSTRLYPLTKTVPKPLVPVLGEPNAAHVVRYLKKYGFTDIATNVFYHKDAIRAALGDGSRFGVRLRYLDEPVLSGSAGAVKLMEPFFRDADPFVVIGCDDLTDLPLDALVDFHRDRKAVATIGLVERDDVSEYGVVVLDERGKIVGFQEKPAPGTEMSRLVNTGVYVFSPGIFERIPGGEVYDFGKQVFPKLQEDGAAFYGFQARDAYWCDIGTPGEYRRVTHDLLAGLFTIPETRGSGVDSSARVSRGARIEEPVWIGAHARIASGASVIGPSVIGDCVVVESGARIERSIIWENSSIGSGARLRDAIVGGSYRVAPNATLDGAIVANDSDVVS